MNQDQQERLAASLRRAVEVQTQMQKGEGPQYEQIRSRSVIMKAAWRAAGSPAELRPMVGHAPDGSYEPRWVLASTISRRATGVRAQDATPEQVAAWQAWLSEKRRLHRQYGWQLDDLRQAASRYQDEKPPSWVAVLALSKAVHNARRVGHSPEDITDATGMTSEELIEVIMRMEEPGEGLSGSGRGWT